MQVVSERTAQYTNLIYFQPGPFIYHTVDYQRPCCVKHSVFVHMCICVSLRSMVSLMKYIQYIAGVQVIPLDSLLHVKIRKYTWNSTEKKTALGYTYKIGQFIMCSETYIAGSIFNLVKVF